MHITHYMKKENSGLARCTIEIAEAEERAGHEICIREPSDDASIVYGSVNGGTDIHSVHSQFNPKHWFDDKPKIMWMHGEPLSSVGNGISMKAIVDLAPKMDAFICMREAEHAIWNSIKRTWLVPKGIDLETYKPIPGVTERLSGAPAVLYCENWRGQRNPLYACVAMEKVWKKFPDARLHLYNCGDKNMKDTFSALAENNKWSPFLRTISGPVDGGAAVNLLLNRVDMVVSGLYPLYARGIEAFGAGKAYIGAGYREHDYPFTCELDPNSMADAIIKCWENYGQVDFRKWAEKHHDVKETARQAVEIYGRYA